MNAYMRHVTEIASSIIANQSIETEAKWIHKEIKITPIETVDFRRTVTSQITMLYDEISHGLNWTSCSITNDGPGEVFCVVNKWMQPEAALPVRGVKNIPCLINLLYLQCPPGQTATVIIDAIKGG